MGERLGPSVSEGQSAALRDLEKLRFPKSTDLRCLGWWAALRCPRSDGGGPPDVVRRPFLCERRPKVKGKAVGLCPTPHHLLKKLDENFLLAPARPLCHPTPISPLDIHLHLCYNLFELERSEKMLV